MASPDLHRFGRAALLGAWRDVTGEDPSIAELQIAGAVATLESGYGTFAFMNRATGEKIRDTNNWGAVQCKSLPPCPDGCFEATDTSPLKVSADNPDGAYQACFVHPSSPAEGAATFIKQVTLRRPLSWAAMKAGDIDAFSDAMHREHYYEGFGATVAERVARHAATVEKYVNEIAPAMGEEVAAARGGPVAVPSDSVFSLENLLLFGGVFGLAYAGRKYMQRRK